MNKLRVCLYIGLCFGYIQNIWAQEVKVDFTKKKQTIEYMGINMEGYHTTGGAEILKNSLSEMLASLPVNAVRIGLPLKEWEPVNDNKSANTINKQGFTVTKSISNSFERLVRMKKQNLAI